MMKLFSVAFLAATLASLPLPVDSRVVSRSPKTCDASTAVERKAWGALTMAERLNYINSLRCLMALPSRHKEGVLPASVSYFIDFTAVHTQQALNIHTSGIFLSWHRHFLYLLEEALHGECAYPARQGIPYWDWPEHPDLEASPLFDGSPSSLGGDGLVRGAADVAGVQDRMNSPGPLEPEKRLHGGGHWAVGGVMAGFSASPQDPAFWLHHGMVDRVWALWQAADPGARRYQYNGTSTFLNPVGVTPEVGNETAMDFGGLDQSVVRLEDVADPLGSAYCYVYV